ncbi:MAG: hypothetical protein GC186_15545 [Rhodobacteraceae bacterium]|nr:hypothetical protein [Paracoccaceae bacterium]
MKRIVAASTILMLLAGAAAAERPDASTPSAVAPHTTEVAAGSFYSGRDLHQMGLNDGDAIVVTDFPTAGLVSHRDHNS